MQKKSVAYYDIIGYIWHIHIPKGTIMRTEKYSVESLIDAFKSHLILSHDSIASILGTQSSMTIYRKLKTLDYCTSYSDAGRFYALKRFIPFNEHGLWSQGEIHFSKNGTLMQTIPILVEKSVQGYFAIELRLLLQVKVQDALIKLFNEKRLHREQLRGEYLYLFPALWQDQLRYREDRIEKELRGELPYYIPQEIADHMRWLLSILNEKQSRLYLGFESIRIGRGGDIAIARITGVNVKTIAEGRHELEQRQNDPDRIRAIGAGRPDIKKKPK
jgi:hypothetical protein